MNGKWPPPHLAAQRLAAIALDRWPSGQCRQPARRKAAEIQ